MKTRGPRLTPRRHYTVTPRPPAPKETHPFYVSAAWSRFRDEVVTERGGMCESPTCVTTGRGAGERVYLDHIRELQDGGAPFDRGNVQVLCARCHGAKTRDAKQARLRGITADVGVARQRPQGAACSDDGNDGGGGWGVL
jgi:5-methylcytosine-specific restriction protein A